MKTKLFTTLYVLALVAVVALADGPRGRTLFAGVRALPLGDKLGHFLLMGILSLLVNLSLGCRRVRLGPARVLAGSLAVMLLVTAEEFSQLYVASRSFDPLDLLFDAAGILIFGQLAHLIASRPDPSGVEPSCRPAVCRPAG